jgi:hypothetical protein
MNKLKLEIRGEKPRKFCEKTNWYNLTDDEKEQFVEKRITAVKESDMSQAAKQAALMRGAIAGISTAAAFDRYVNRDEYWFR